MRTASPGPFVTSLCAVAAAALIASGVAAPALANDTALGGNGASFGPMQETRAAMRSEHIRIRMQGDDFHVHATYRLANLTDEPLELQIGFPESVCDPEWSDCMPGAREAFREMRTTVRGVEVPPVVEPTGEDSPWAGDYPFLWTFSVTFAPGEELEVVHRYRVVGSVDSTGFRYLDYVVRTGANWGEPIGSAVFELDLPAESCGVYVRKPGGAAGGRELGATRDEETGRWHARWSYTDWVPDQDIGVQVMPWRACLLNLECPGAWRLGDSLDRDAEVRELAERWSAEQLRLCRNLPWAVTGYGFTSADLRDAFYGDTPVVLFESMVLPHAADPGWTERRLTAEMLAYARFVREAERLQQGQEPRDARPASRRARRQAR